MAKAFKSLLSVFLAVFMVVSLLAIPSSAAVALSKSTITLTKGYQTTLSVTGTSKTVTWSTGDKSIATVNSKGKVVGKAPGSTYVYAKVGGTTLKCKVTVVAAKITASTSSVTFDKKGQTKTITVTVKGSHKNLTVGTTDKSVATASWVKPIQWNGDKISYTITAQNPGNARIKVYLKDYPNTCYNYVDVKVGGSSSNNSNNSGNTSGKMAILTNPKTSIDVATGGTAVVQAYATKQSNLAYSIADTSIATASAESAFNNYRNYNITGLKAGTTTLRLYDKTDTSNYYDVTINVGDSSYYEFYTTYPMRRLSTDKVMTIQASSNSSYYMLVPENYDPAYVNTIVAKKFNKFSYYEVYNERPPVYYSTDKFYDFYHSNSKYTYGARYMLIPLEYDQASIDTAVAKYNGVFNYWVVYTDTPIKPNAADRIETWNIVDPDTGKSINRYLLIPQYGYDLNRINSIKDDDINRHSSYTYYVGYTTWPTVSNNTDQIIMYRKNNSYKYMVVPKDGSGMAKANDAIAKDTGIYEYNVIYSSQPVAADDEYIVTVQYGKSFYYVLIKRGDKSPDTSIAERYANGVKDD